MANKVSSLKITECPAAFADFARKHNALVDLIKSMTGRNGINVAAGDLRIVIEGGGVSSLTGVTERQFQVCESGVAVTYTFLTVD